MEIPFYMKVRKSECSNRYHLHTIVLQINCRRWPLRGEKKKVLPKGGLFAGRKAEKGTERFYFFGPQNQRKPQSMEIPSAKASAQTNDVPCIRFSLREHPRDEHPPEIGK